MAVATGLTYADAGVDIDAGEQFAKMIKERVALAWPGMGEEIGGFAGTILIPKTATRMAASTDGTGTKAILAALVEMFGGIGQDAVAMSAVDTYMAGILPAWLLDSLDVAVLNPEKHIAIIDSLIDGCKLAGCRLLGGETAELPDMFRHDWMFNLNTAVVGFNNVAIEHAPILAGQPVYGWNSNGLGSNGFSLARKIFNLKEGPAKVRRRLERHWDDLGCTLAEALLEPTAIWISAIEDKRKLGVVFAGHAHITGGGLPGNIHRILPNNLRVVINRSSWTRPPIFPLMQRLGDVEQVEMDRTFNQGIQVISIVDPGLSTFEMAESPDVVQIGSVDGRDGDEPQVFFSGRFND